MIDTKGLIRYENLYWELFYRVVHFQSSYFHRKRKIVQKELFKKKSDDQINDNEEEDFSFAYPFNDLLIWAVLTSRHGMAECMWVHGEDAMAKCLLAIR